MTNANVKKEKERKEQQKTNHTLKLTITKISNKHRGIKVFIKTILTYVP